jgi:hypothetical protein
MGRKTSGKIKREITEFKKYKMIYDPFYLRILS